MGNGTDRDLASRIVSLFGDIKTLFDSFVQSNYTPAIITQPVDYTGTGGTASFTVVALNVQSYKWQYKTSEDADWTNSSAASGSTATLSVGNNATNQARDFRCKLTGFNGSIVYTNTVNIVAQG